MAALAHRTGVITRVLLVAALSTLFLILRRRQRLGADAFDPDTDDDVTPDDADPSAANR